MTSGNGVMHPNVMSCPKYYGPQYYGLAQVRKWCYAANSFTGVNASPSFHHTACWWGNFAVWGLIWKYTVEKSWLIWKYTVEKSRVQVDQWSYAANSFTGVTASLSFQHHNWAKKLLTTQTAKKQLNNAGLSFLSFLKFSKMLKLKLNDTKK